MPDVNVTAGKLEGPLAVWCDGAVITKHQMGASTRGIHFLEALGARCLELDATRDGFL